MRSAHVFPGDVVKVVSNGIDTALSLVKSLVNKWLEALVKCL